MIKCVPIRQHPTTTTQQFIDTRELPICCVIRFHIKSMNESFYSICSVSSKMGLSLSSGSIGVGESDKPPHGGAYNVAPGCKRRR